MPLDQIGQGLSTGVTRPDGAGEGIGGGPYSRGIIGGDVRQVRGPMVLYHLRCMGDVVVPVHDQVSNVAWM
ncbi:hypothetical protein ACFS5L_02345 [Streptomyces phyllanthi]|uniref:Uncharacterized protein n=1 Tax=Streptomyces phyllanthi TaxID=1803180 RepID=A0A5N8VUN7_9ACTN|nr:hypothetical protein [Streptomyces phyllanthi]MPY38492.1 hypothetical protein [Streptomyces phyllanthi]